MADISLQRKHAYGVDEARTRVEKLVNKFKANMPSMIEYVNWAPDGCSAEAGGKMFKGQFRVTADTVSVDLELIGFLAKMAKGKVQEKLEKQLGEDFPA